MPADPVCDTFRGPASLARGFLELGAVSTAPGCARAWTREITGEWQLTRLADAAELVVSELITNSVLASQGRGSSVIRLMLSFNQSELVICVRDDCPGTPQARHPGAEDESGRGLGLVEALSARNGWYWLGEGIPGKVVWAALRTDCAPAGTRSPHASLGPS